MMRWFWAGCVAGIVFLAGCENKPKVATVSGTVNLNGKPLPEGDITLANTNGLPPDIFPVKDGKFSGPAKEGKVKVEIRAYRPAKPLRTPTTQESKPSPENYLPARYNSATTLTAEVTASGLNPSTFDCSTK